jgi:hypothetical protein
MRLPFTVEQFFEVFARYNLAVWPAQPALLALGVLAVALVLWRPSETSRLTSGILAALWAWMAVAYHLAFFATINPAARLFGALFLVQSGLFLFLGVARGRLAFERPAPLRATLGAALAAYALAAYPALGRLAGHRFPAAPTFGAPCPTTILTLALLLSTRRPVPWALAVIPLLWAGVGAVAALQLGVPQDLGLPVAGLVVLAAFATPARSVGAAN